MTTPTEFDGYPNNPFQKIIELEERVAQLERRAPLALFQDGVFKPPGKVIIEKEGLEISGPTSIFSGIMNFGSPVPVSVASATNDFTIVSSFMELSWDSGTSGTITDINGGILGDIIWLIAASGHSFTISESGNLRVLGTTDTLSSDKFELMIFNGTNWTSDRA